MNLKAAIFSVFCVILLFAVLKIMLPVLAWHDAHNWHKVRNHDAGAILLDSAKKKEHYKAFADSLGCQVCDYYSK